MNGVSLFKMGNKDYTRFITLPSYKVNSEPITKSYEDINKIGHDEYIRDQIKGSFTLKFFDDNSYDEPYEGKSAVTNFQEFFSEYQRLRQYNGDIEIEVYVNNLNVMKTITAKMKMEPANNMPYMNSGKSYDGFDVTITEK